MTYQSIKKLMISFFLMTIFFQQISCKKKEVHNHKQSTNKEKLVELNSLQNNIDSSNEDKSEDYLETRIRLCDHCHTENLFYKKPKEMTLKRICASFNDVSEMNEWFEWNKDKQNSPLITDAEIRHIVKSFNEKVSLSSKATCSDLKTSPN